MSDIDPEKLEQALRLYRDGTNDVPALQTIIAAARAHLATLPKLKEVEVEAWAVVSCNGTAQAFYDSTCKRLAENHVEEVPGRQVVRLTGTAKVRA